MHPYMMPINSNWREIENSCQLGPHLFSPGKVCPCEFDIRLSGHRDRISFVHKVHSDSVLKNACEKLTGHIHNSETICKYFHIEIICFYLLYACCRPE